MKEPGTFDIIGFFTCLISILALVFYFILTIFKYDPSTSCSRVCAPSIAMTIEDSCHCKIKTGWEVKEERVNLD